MIKYIKERLAEVHLDMKLVTAFHPTRHGQRGGRPSGSRAYRCEGYEPSPPNMCKPCVKEGVTESIVLYNTVDLEYLTVHAAHALAISALE
jgi:hypothetical protein